MTAVFKDKHMNKLMMPRERELGFVCELVDNVCHARWIYKLLRLRERSNRKTRLIFEVRDAHQSKESILGFVLFI